MLPTYWLSFAVNLLKFAISLLIFVVQLVVQLVNICYKFVNICCPASCIASYILLAIVNNRRLMIEYVNLLLLLTMFGSITFGCCYVYY